MVKATLTHDDGTIDYHCFIGGNPTPQRWVKYLNQWIRPLRPYIIAIKNEIIEKGLLGTTAEIACNEYMFTFGDNAPAIAFSWRAWGDLMDAIIGTKRGYMAYYMKNF